MNRFATCHFCDDIRPEVGNKTSLMGIYGGELFVAGNPAVLPKLCAVIFASTPADEPLSSLSLSLRVDGETIYEFAIPAADLARMQDRVKSTSDEADPIKRMSLGSNIVLSPFVVTKDVTVQALAICDGEEISAGRLYVHLTESPPTQSAT
jgi:hypothetical protein